MEEAEALQSELLAQAWSKCPQACEACDTVRRGCIGFSPAFMGGLKAIGHFGYLAGVVLYNARWVQGHSTLSCPVLPCPALPCAILRMIHRRVFAWGVL